MADNASVSDHINHVEWCLKELRYLRTDPEPIDWRRDRIADRLEFVAEVLRE